MQCETRDQGNGSSHYIPATTFQDRQREYFAERLGRKWDCDIPGHTICVPTEDGGHHQLSDKDFMVWVNALCLGEATTSQPPDGILTSVSPLDGSQTSEVRAVPVPPSYRRNIGSPILLTTSSIHDTLSSEPSSGVPGPGHHFGKLMKWFGIKCITGIESVIIFKRCWQYEYRLRLWSAIEGGGSWRKRNKQFFDMLGDMVELSKDCYSRRVNKRAFAIASRATQLTLSPMPTLDREDALTLRMNCMLCFVPIDIAHHRGGHRGPELDFMYDIYNALTKVPMALQNSHTASTVIRILGAELLYAPTVTALTVSQGFLLCNVLSVIRSLRDFTADEMRVIYSLAMRRTESHNEMSCIHCQPWEVTIIGICSSHDPVLKDILRGPSGIPCLVLALNAVLGVDIRYAPNDDPDAIDDILSALSLLADYGCCAEIAAYPEVVALMINVLRRQFRPHVKLSRAYYRALHILKTIVDYDPILFEDFVQLGGETALAGIASFLKRTAAESQQEKYIARKSMMYLNQLRRILEQGQVVDYT